MYLVDIWWSKYEIASTKRMCAITSAQARRQRGGRGGLPDFAEGDGRTLV